MCLIGFNATTVCVYNARARASGISQLCDECKDKIACHELQTSTSWIKAYLNWSCVCRRACMHRGLFF